MKKITLIILALLFVSHHASAATISFSRPPETVRQGDIFELSLSLDPEDVSVNTLSGSIKVSGSLDIDKVNDGGSLVPLWIEKPQVDKGVVSFSGLIPGGFSGVLGPYWEGKKPGRILTFTLKARTTGAGFVTANLDTLLANDGDATSLSVKPVSLSFVAGSGPGYVQPKSRDTDWPEPFTVEVVSGWGDFDSHKVALFSTYDEQSGMSHFMVKEGDRDFTTATSPYILKDGGSSALVVRAYDNTGNYRESSWDAAEASEASPTFSGAGFWVILVISLACIALLFKKFLRK